MATRRSGEAQAFHPPTASTGHVPRYPYHARAIVSNILRTRHKQHAPDDPINHQQRPRAHADLLAPIHAPPRVHRRKAAHEAEPPEVEHRRVPDVRERAEVEVPERARDRLVRARAPEQPVLRERVPLLRELGELAPEVLALLRGYLRSLWVRSELVSGLRGRRDVDSLREGR